MDIPMLVAELRDQLAALDVTSRIEVLLAKAGEPRCGPSGTIKRSPRSLASIEHEILDIQLSEVSITPLPLRIPLALPEEQVAGFRDRLGAALGGSLSAQPLWLVRTTLVDVRVGRKRYRKELEITCEYAVVGATVSTCPRHGWEARAVRIHSVVLPELDAEFQLMDVRLAR